MIAKSNYGFVNSPVISQTSNPCVCHYCFSESSFSTKDYTKSKKAGKIDKGSRALRIITNGGPTGRVYICKKHAIQFSQELNSLIENWESEEVQNDGVHGYSCMTGKFVDLQKEHEHLWGE